ncbi:hypothetical protein Enr13x_32680 [Stieleria neptunia]|uniref:Uncharacterized protein n=1 Tax=Stieleria neptunia TaxID=2527979 RepID=A0A518HRC5_9BACT|nr:hypothetical protein Enr13x_32680 [Stieleria neptunia]
MGVQPPKRRLPINPNECPPRQTGSSVSMRPETSRHHQVITNPTAENRQLAPVNGKRDAPPTFRLDARLPPVPQSTAAQHPSPPYRTGPWDPPGAVAAPKSCLTVGQLAESQSGPAARKHAFWASSKRSDRLKGADGFHRPWTATPTTRLPEHDAHSVEGKPTNKEEYRLAVYDVGSTVFSGDLVIPMSRIQLAEDLSI